MRKKRYSIKPQDDYFGIVDEYNEDRVCIVNGIHTKLEAEWLCDELNGLHDENEELRRALKIMTDRYDCSVLKADHMADDGREYYHHGGKYCEKFNLDREEGFDYRYNY